MVKRTFQPHGKRARRKHGFMIRNKSKGGRKVLKSRRRKGRKRLAS